MITQFLTYPLLIILAYQDIKSMSVLQILLVSLLSIQALTGIYEIGLLNWGANFIINSLLIIIQLSVLAIFYKFKNADRKFSIIDNIIGAGDIIFFFFLAAAFSPINYVTFLVTSLTISLIAHLLVSRNSNRMPLIGYLSIIFIICVIFIHDPYDDTLLMSLLPTI